MKNMFFRIIAIVLLLVIVYLLFMMIYRSSWEAVFTYGWFFLALGIGNLVYWFSKKGSSVRRFLQISAWLVLAYYLVCLFRMRGIGLGFDYCVLIGYPVLSVFSYLICRYYSKWLSVGKIALALFLPCFIMEWPCRIFFWNNTVISLPSSVFLLLGLVTGIWLYAKRSYLTYIFTGLCLVASVWMFVIGYEYWINYQNYGTFTGRVERTPMKDYQFLNEKGDTVCLSDWKGKKVLIDCWTMHCGYCYQAMPLVQRLHERYKGGDEVYVTSVFVVYRNEKKEEGAQIVKKEGFSFPVWSIDKTHELLSDLNITGYPCVLLFDEDGCLIFHGSIEGAEELLKKEIE